MDVKHGPLDIMWLFVVLVLFAVFGGLAKDLVRWEPVRPWQRRIGNGMATVFVAVPVGFYVSDLYPDQLGLILICSTVAGWGGSELLDVLWRLAQTRIERVVENDGE